MTSPESQRPNLYNFSLRFVHHEVAVESDARAVRSFAAGEQSRLNQSVLQRCSENRVADPHLKLQLRQQPFKPASVPTRFHPDTHFEFLRSQISIELFRVLAMLQPPFLQLTCVRIDKRNLLEARMVIRSYNDHRSAPFSRALVGWHDQSLLGRRSRHCYGINYLIDRVLNESMQFFSGGVRKLPIPNLICRDQEGHLYRVPTVAVLGRFSNATVVDTCPSSGR